MTPMKEWYMINSQPTLNSGFERSEWDSYVSDSFDETLTETQLGRQIYMCRGQFDGNKFETEISTCGIVQSETPDAYTQGWQRQLLTRISDRVQDYKYIRYDDHIWVIMTMPSDNQIYNKCVIHLCNYTLKWQDKKGRIYYYPASIQDATQYNTGIEGTKEIHTGYVQLMAWVSLDKITAGLERDMRMFIDVDKASPTPYVITSKSTVAYSYGGDMRVMRITFTEDELNRKTDRIDLMLCDYADPDSIPRPTVPIEITYSGSPEIRIGGRKTFSTDVPVTFSMIAADMWKDKIRLTQTDDHSCVIKCQNESAMVGANIKITAKNETQTSELLVKVIGGV